MRGFREILDEAQRNRIFKFPMLLSSSLLETTTSMYKSNYCKFVMFHTIQFPIFAPAFSRLIGRNCRHLKSIESKTICLIDETDNC